MMHSLFRAVTLVLLFAWSSADLSERPCFIPLQWLNLAINPTELTKTAALPSLYNRTGVEVDAFKYKATKGKNYLRGMFLTTRVNF